MAGSKPRLGTRALHWVPDRVPLGVPPPYTGVWLFYDTSPVHVEFRETRRGLLPFFTSVCAIVGGTFSVCTAAHCRLPLGSARQLQGGGLAWG